jgi:oligoendopeptidase F
MHAAIREAFPEFQRHLRAKARLLGLPALAEYDLDAPVGEAKAWPYETSRHFIVETFSAASPKLGALAERAFAEGWIDAEPREGKDAGGFSTGVGGDESRVFLNYLPVYDQMGVLAHELGHSYQNVAVHERGRTPLQAPPDDVPSPLGFPMTLAETASTICEALAQRAARAGATPAQEIAILDGWLQSFSSLVFGIYARFILEREVFARRAERELSPSEIEGIMKGAWREVAGDAIDPATISGTDWTKSHFFIDTLWYYNFPYAFGVLFAVGLLAARDTNPDGFNERFDALLADSGMTDAADLAARFGLDLRDPVFWRTSLDAYRADVARYEALTGGDRVIG